MVSSLSALSAQFPSCTQLFHRNYQNPNSSSLSFHTAATVEERLKSFLGQLQTEFGILDRIVYKNKNQHRRSSYFQYLLKVRRDLRLLQSAHLDELLNSSFLVIHGNRPKQKVQLLESLKRRRCDGGKHNFLERLLGVARLLSQMLEPMLKAATEISTVLARSFFMGFSLTVLALLARLRVLVQQILLDVVSVFNMVSSLSQKEQSVKLSQAGIEVFREYYPTNEQAYSLECVWEADKFVLREKINKTGTKNQEQDVSDNGSQGASTIQYQSIEVLLGDNGKMDPNQTSEGLNNMEDATGSLMDPATGSGNGKKIEDGPHVAEPPSENISAKGGLLTTLSSSQTHSSKLKPVSRNKVAFVSVKKPAPSSANFAGIPISETQNKNSKEDPFFS